MRSGQLRRSPLTRNAGIARTKGLQPRSKKTAEVYRTRRAPLVAELLQSRPWCEIRWDDDCQARSTQVHEPEKRSKGADITDPEACVTACAHCHRQVHLNPAEAERRGWLARSSAVGA